MNASDPLHYGYSRTHKVARKVIKHIGIPHAQVRDDGHIVFVTGNSGYSRDWWRELCKWHGTKMPDGTEIRVCGCPVEFAEGGQ